MALTCYSHGIQDIQGSTCWAGWEADPRAPWLRASYGCWSCCTGVVKMAMSCCQDHAAVQSFWALWAHRAHPQGWPGYFEMIPDDPMTPWLTVPVLCLYPWCSCWPQTLFQWSFHLTSFQRAKGIGPVNSRSIAIGSGFWALDCSSEYSELFLRALCWSKHDFLEEVRPVWSCCLCGPGRLCPNSDILGHGKPMKTWWKQLWWQIPGGKKMKKTIGF